MDTKISNTNTSNKENDFDEIVVDQYYNIYKNIWLIVYIIKNTSLNIQKLLELNILRNRC